MECMIDILLSSGTLIAAVVTAIATCVIVYLSYIQKEIAKQKRKDDLFKIRWEFYQEIVEYIKDTYEKEYKMIQDITRWQSKEGIQNHIEITHKNKSRSKELNIQDYYFIFKIKNLFDAEIANLIQEFIFDHRVSLILKSVYKIEVKPNFDQFHHWTLSWLPSQEFEKKFDKYLKLDKV